MDVQIQQVRYTPTQLTCETQAPNRNQPTNKTFQANEFAKYTAYQTLDLHCEGSTWRPKVHIGHLKKGNIKTEQLLRVYTYSREFIFIS